MKKLSLIIILFIIVKILSGQNHFECGTPDNLSLKSATCNDWNNYAAVNPNNTPIKIVRITIHIMQKLDGTGNFPDSYTSRCWLSGTLMDELNGRMKGLKSMNLPTSSPTITDCRVRFSLANIYFWQNDYAWTFRQDTIFGNYLRTKYVNNQDSVLNKNNSVHIFMCENATGMGIVSNIGNKSWIALGGIYTNYLKNDCYGAVSILAHELGHSLGLRHTWKDTDYCNDTPNNPNCWNVNEPRPGEPNTGQCLIPSNNLMDYNVSQNALTICQINRIHYYLLGGDGNISDCLISGASVVNPTIVGPDLIGSYGAAYMPDNLQLGVISQWSLTPAIYFQKSADCSNTTNATPNSSSSFVGEGQINYTFDWQKSGIRTLHKNVWIGKVNQLNLCAFDRNIYQSDNIFSPGASCQPMNAIIDNGKSVTLIGGEITLNSGFEVTKGAEFQVIINNGNELELGAPILAATSTVSFLTCNSATSGGNVISEGGLPITERGLCWGISPNPTIDDSKVVSGAGRGSFSATLSPLVAGTTYHVRSYATNSSGRTGYGTEATYTRSISGPLLLTTTAGFITTSTATSGGNVIFDGCTPVRERGICWSTSGNPTTKDSRATSSAGIGSFTAGMTGLSATTTYYVRTYAINEVDTVYGAQISFTTMKTDHLLSELTQTAISGGPTNIAIQYKLTLTHYAEGDTHFSIIHTNTTNSGNMTENITVRNGETIGTLTIIYEKQVSAYFAKCDFNGTQAGYTNISSQLSYSIGKF